MALALFCGMALSMVAAATASAHATFTARYTVRPLQGVSTAAFARQAAAGTTVPTWTSSITSLGNSYTYSMIGNSPFVKETSPTTNVGTDIIPVRFRIGNRIYDPNSVNNGCTGSNSVTRLTMQSPVFTKYADKVGTFALGNVQYVAGFQRENFAKYVFGAGALNPGYQVNLPATVRPEVVVQVPAADSAILDSTSCQALAGVDINWWDNYVQHTLLPGVAKTSTNPTRFPFFLFDNVVLYNGNTSNCCIIGYHGAYQRSDFGGAVQTYGNGDYESTGDFTGLSDVGAISHEVGEWMDDPSGGNATPAWGHIGQVSGCQGNLEVGDPLSGTSITQAMPNGITYHPQELAFFSWFYRQSPSIGLHGWYSSNGTFRTGAGAACT